MAAQGSELLKVAPIEAHCPTCNAERKCDLHGHVKKPWQWESNDGRNSSNGEVSHSLLECRGCETVFYLRVSCDSENVDYKHGPNGELLVEYFRDKNTYPFPTSQIRPNWFDAIGKVDRQLQSILNEMYVAYDNQAYILTVVGLRTALDRTTEVLQIDPAISFEEKLSKLKNGGWIGQTEHSILQVITNAGNAAAHRGWAPSGEDAKKMLTAMEAFIYRAFVVGQDALAIKASIPPKPKRKKANT